jgi:serine/threonine protein kinase
MIITAVVVTLAILYSERSGETETETIFGNPAFAKIYRPAGNEPFGCGVQACTWPVVRIGDERHFVAKIYKHNSTDALFSTEVKNMRQIGSREGYSNLIDAFGDKEHKNVLVMDFVAGKKVSKMLLKYDGQLVPKNVLVDMMTKMVERLAYLHDTAYLMHRDLHFD